MPILEIDRLTKSFGGLTAVNNLDLKIEKGEILGLIGPNGAGKSTAFNVISGFLKPSSGRILFKGKDTTRLRMDQVASIGLVRTFQHTEMFSDLTVSENISAGLHLQGKMGLFRSVLGGREVRDKTSYLRQEALKIIEIMGLSTRQSERAGDLPHGYQRLLGIAIALASKPELLMLDEPLTGMIADEVKTTMETIIRIRKNIGTTILLVEHNMKAVMGLCDRIAVLEFGTKIAEGSPQKIRQNPDVIRAYLGDEAYVS